MNEIRPDMTSRRPTVKQKSGNKRFHVNFRLLSERNFLMRPQLVPFCLSVHMSVCLRGSKNQLVTKMNCQSAHLSDLAFFPSLLKYGIFFHKRFNRRTRTKTECITGSLHEYPLNTLSFSGDQHAISPYNVATQ